MQKIISFLKKSSIIKNDMYILEFNSGKGELVTKFKDVKFKEWQCFELDEEKVEWCEDNILSDFRVDFMRCDIHHYRYNPYGAVNAHEYQFPYPDSHFDVVLMVNMFNSMQPSDVRQFCWQASRVCNIYGKIIISAFIDSSAPLFHISEDEPDKVYYDQRFIEITIGKYGVKLLESRTLEDGQKLLVFIKNG